MATYLTSNTGSTKSTDRTAGGSKPDSTPATGSSTTTVTGAVTSVSGSVGVGASPTTGNVSVYLNTTGVTANTYGSSTTVPVIAVNSQGQITSATNVGISSTIPSGASTSQSLLYGNSSAPIWLTEHFNVKAFGATGNGSTDDHTAVNAAIAALNSAGGGTLYFPNGTYKMTAAITTITVTCKVMGDGINSTTINQTSTNDALVISTVGQCIVQDLTLQTTSSYNALTISAPTGNFNSRSIVNNVNVGGYPAIGFNFNEAFAIITNCTLTGAIGIQIQNLVNPDESAGMITQCQFNTNGGLGVALYADGVQIIDNYFYDNNVSIEVFVNNTTGTLADFWIQDNHIEYSIASAIRFNNTSTSAVLANVIITGNELAWSHTGSATCNAIDQTGTNTTAWLIAFTISANVFNTNVNSIYLPYASYGCITGNSITGSTTAIYLGSVDNNVIAQSNQIASATNPNTDAGTNNSLGNEIGYSASFTLTGGGATETKYLNVTNCYLGKIPTGVTAQVTSDRTVGCYYNPSDSSNSSTQVAIVFFKYSGANLSAGSVSITARVGP